MGRENQLRFLKVAFSVVLFPLWQFSYPAYNHQLVSELKKCKLILLLGLSEDEDCDFCIPALFEIAVAKNVNKLKRVSEWKTINCMVKARTVLPAWQVRNTLLIEGLG